MALPVIAGMAPGASGRMFCNPCWTASPSSDWAGLAVPFLVFFLYGLFIYGSLYAAAGSVCSTHQDAHQATLAVMLLFVLSNLLLLQRLAADAESALFTVLSFVPLFTPDAVPSPNCRRRRPHMAISFWRSPS